VSDSLLFLHAPRRGAQRNRVRVPVGHRQSSDDRKFGVIRPTRREGASAAKLPAYIAAALKAHPAARKYYEGLPAPRRRRYVAWIETARREATKFRRLKEVIRLLTAGKELGLK
jgi:uncharacterized protein YdeI (YjbR/CyaY-like superfamily)